MKRKLIQSDSDKLKLFTNLVQQANTTTPEGKAIFRESTKTAIREVRDRLALTLAERDDMITERRARREAQREATRILIEMVRKTWDTIQYRVSIGREPTTHLARFGLGLTGNRPDGGDTREWVARARRVIAADADGEERGYLPLAEPDRAVIEGQIELAMSAMTAHEAAIQSLALIRKRLSDLRIETDDLTLEVTTTIQLAFRHSPATAKRNAMRILGFRFLDERSRVDAPEPGTEPEPIDTEG